MTIESKAKELFEYIAEVYAVDLPVVRNVLSYGAERWWQADLISSRECRIKEIDTGNASVEQEANGDSDGTWLAVYKTDYDNPPPLPEALKDWLDLAPPVPTRRPVHRPSISKRVLFESDRERVAAYDEYVKAWIEWDKTGEGSSPPIPPACEGWLDSTQGQKQLRKPLPEREQEDHFEDDPNRLSLLENYMATQWTPWANRVLPQFRANQLYDQLFSIHQRLSVEGDRWEILWGHVLLSWQHSPGQSVYHPLLVTPMFLEFQPEHRRITLTPRQHSQIDLECLRDLAYDHKDTVLKLVRQLNNSESPANPWSTNEMRGLAASLTGYLSSEASAETNRYDTGICSSPQVASKPTIYNAPIIFLRERIRHFWIEDAKKVAAAIGSGSPIPPFIRTAVADPNTDGAARLTRPDSDRDMGASSGLPDSDFSYSAEDAELYFPLPFNDQQREIWDRLSKQFGVLVQGPPGTGKSHTIANIISAELAYGHKVLVTSQTENALKVLRGLIPPEIRSLCVCQLGNDAESKKQLHDAVTAIGHHLVEKGSKARAKRIHQLKDELKLVRQEQALLHHQIRDWAKLDSEALGIDGETISAHEAAKECSIRREQHSWLPDKIAPETALPLTGSELHEMCSLLFGISLEDSRACLALLPDLASLEPLDQIKKIFAELRTYHDLSDETEQLRSVWADSLRISQEDDLGAAVLALESALTALREIGEDWQKQILDFMVSNDSQASFWRKLVHVCSEWRDKAFRHFDKTQGFRIEGLSELDPEIEWMDYLDELAIVVERGRDPGGLLARIGLSKHAKQLFHKVRVNGKKLSNLERIDAVCDYLSYETHLNRLELRWEQAITTVGGPQRDVTNQMPIADVDARLKKARQVVNWVDVHVKKVRDILSGLGCPGHRDKSHRESDLVEHLRTLQGQIAVLRRKDSVARLSTYRDSLKANAKKPNAHSMWERLASAMDNRSSQDYETAFNELVRLVELKPRVEKLESLLQRMRSAAPRWTAQIAEAASRLGKEAIPADWQTAWRWQRLDGWLTRLHSRENVESLQARLEKLRRQEGELITQLVTERTWERQIENVKDQHYMALTAWATAMRHYGKGGGKYAQRFLAAAARAMIDAVKAVPVWIMPLYRVVQSFPAEAGLFDLAIVDEASQCDIRALPVLFRAKRVLIVGDPEQISPANVGVPRDKVFEVIRQKLSAIPHPERFIIDNSLFAITQTIPGMTRTMLTEHFRCVPAIIEFNNNLCPSYGGKLEPLRQPNPHERLDPPIITCFVQDGFKNNNDVNEPEAEALVEALVCCCRCERYQRRTLGVMSLLGENQAKYISELIAQHIDEREREARRIICGDAYAFQGDERDVILLSLVVAPNASFAPLVKEDARQRFNVATSRARDQVFLFHSVKLEDIGNEECMRHKVLSWYQNPPLFEMEAGMEVLRQKADSPFEIEVGERLIRRGYKVIPQFRAFPRDFQYRIDLLVQGPKGRVAVECDGDRWHGPDRWEYDQRRETQLRRAGLKFWRISGSSFYRDKNRSLEALWPFLETHCT